MPTPGSTDFQRHMREPGLTILRSFEDANHYTLLPQALEVATRDDRHLDFVLELVRGQNPVLPPQPYGVLDLKLSPQYRLEDGLGVLRRLQPGAMLAESNFVSG